MRFQVSNQLRQPTGSRVQYQLLEQRLCCADVFLSGLVADVEFLRTDKGLLVSVRARCTLRGRCSRCLKDMDFPIHLMFYEEYLSTVDIFTGLPLPILDDSDNFLIGADSVLDLSEALRQYSLMSAPLSPLCKSDCQGLCPRCGHDLNQGLCPCPQEQYPRRASLARGLSSTPEEGGT